MAVREKIAWLTLVTMLVAYGFYFGWAGPRIGFGDARMVDIVWALAPVASVHALVVIVGSILIAVMAAKEANAPADERDRAIVRRGSTIGYYVLLTGMILVGVVMPFSEPAWKIVNTALLAIVIAEAVRHGIIVFSYRRGWHG